MSDPIDVHVGARVRLMRRHQKISQVSLSEHLGITFQQVQKYERGANRISASKLYHIAEMFGVEIAYFYEGLPSPASASSDPAVSKVNSTLTDVTQALTENPALVRIVHLPRRERSMIADLINSMADSAKGSETAEA